MYSLMALLDCGSSPGLPSLELMGTKEKSIPICLNYHSLIFLPLLAGGIPNSYRGKTVTGKVMAEGK